MILFKTAAATLIIGVASIIDGDTLKLGDLKIRIWGLDAPEMNTNAEVRSRNALHNLAEGKELKCEPNGDITYDRVVAKCFLGDTDIACWMVENQFAKPYRKFSGDYYDDCLL